MIVRTSLPLFFFFNDTATTEIYTLSLHDALPICTGTSLTALRAAPTSRPWTTASSVPATPPRSEEHTSELQSHLNLVCRLLLEKKKKLDDIEQVTDADQGQFQIFTAITSALLHDS